ncbi:DedA family protein [Paenibacillus senegalimassiliensis]|uniref:DedA family protein n=1 Tax=Paenibacillus senegalimassiliensis TaxID=1737426 RepID=UPI00073F90EC|nr:DedA family protein [Paenibacillus senegalimassiliensis]
MNVLDWIERMFEQYGYLVLLLGLPVDFIALPLPPGQTTLTYTGYLAYERILSLPWALLAAYAGSFIGVTATYFIGYRVGAPLAERYGRWIFLRPAYLQRTRKVYEKYGNKMLLISFFIPGVRQFFGYFVGMIRVPFRTFALYASVGAALWVSLFVGIGYIFGEQWQVAIHWVEKYMIYFFIGVGVLASTLIYVKWRKWRLKVAKLSR